MCSNVEKGYKMREIISRKSTNGGRMHLQVSFKEVIASIIKAVDVMNPILKHHHRRVAVMAYHIGNAYGLDIASLSHLVIASALHDVGALTVADEEALMVLDVIEPAHHAVLGASILSSYRAFDHVSEIIRYHHLSYTDYLSALKADKARPELALILHLADRIEITSNRSELGLDQVETIINTLLPFKGTLFSPKVMNHFFDIATQEEVWFDFDHLSFDELLSRVDFELVCQEQDLEALEELVYTFSKIIDYKCNFTASHSIAVAHVTYSLAKLCGLDEAHAYELKIAGYLHDIGKIGIPSEIISKPGVLDAHEFNTMKAHPYFSRAILKEIRGFDRITHWASSHHETKDKMGYPRKLNPNEMGLEIEILSNADVFTALCEERPYRQAHTEEEALNIMKEYFVNKLGTQVFPLLSEHAHELNALRKKVQNMATCKYESALRAAFENRDSLE